MLNNKRSWPHRCALASWNLGTLFIAVEAEAHLPPHQQPMGLWDPPAHFPSKLTAGPGH